MKVLYIQSYFMLALLLTSLCLPSESSGQTEDEIYEEVKLDILCRTLRFLVRKENPELKSEAVRCESLDLLEQSIPPSTRQTRRIFQVFKAKTYKSYGKAKLDIRLNKLLGDIYVEIARLKLEQDWEEKVNTLNFELKDVKQNSLERIRKGEKHYQNSFLSEDSNRINNANISNPTQSSSTFLSPTEMIIVIIFGLILAGGIVYLALQNQQLKTQLGNMEDFFQERYSRLDNRIDTKASVQDFQGIIMKFNFMNEQLSVSREEINLLKSRNKNKISAEELVAKRTEHLESYEYNPSIQVYYTRFRPDLNMFVSQEFKTEPSRDSIFKIEINLADPSQASFKVTDRSEYHQIALANPNNMLQPCEYLHEPYNDDKIVNLEHGLLEKKEEGWAVIKKAKIAFE